MQNPTPHRSQSKGFTKMENNTTENVPQVPKKSPTRAELVRDTFTNPENIKKIAGFFGDDMKKATKFNQTMMLVAMDEKYNNFTPASIYRCAMYAAELDLSPQKNLGLFYIVPRKNKKTKTIELCFDMGFRGWLTLLDRGEKACKTYNVYKCDQFSLTIDTTSESGWDEKILYKPNYDKWNEADPTWVKENLAGILVMILDHRRGAKVVKYVKRDVLDKIRSYSPSASSEYSPWQNWTAEMYQAKAIKYVVSKTSMDDKTARAVEIENMFHILNKENQRQLSPLETVLSGNQLPAGEVIDVEDQTSSDEENPYFATPITLGDENAENN